MILLHVQVILVRAIDKCMLNVQPRKKCTYIKEERLIVLVSSKNYGVLLAIRIDIDRNFTHTVYTTEDTTNRDVLCFTLNTFSPYLHNYLQCFIVFPNIWFMLLSKSPTKNSGKYSS